jgi:hypothetical protein
MSEEIRTLIRTMAENSGWGAPKIHRELLNLDSKCPSARWPDICDASDIAAMWFSQIESALQGR